jgi:protein TonB
MPRYRENRPPVYPGTARQRGYEGDVLIAAEIRADGRIGTVRVKRSSGYASLDDSALEAVRAWRFEPARRMGAAVDAWVEIPIRFKLSPGDSLM